METTTVTDHLAALDARCERSARSSAPSSFTDWLCQAHPLEAR
ncbi:hypothetical protein [Micromonospora sp. KLBMP9576]